MAAKATTIGSMRQRVTLLKPAVGAAGDNGQPAVTFAAVAVVFAAVEATDGSEAVEAHRVQAGVSWDVTTRRRADVRADWKLTWNGRSLDVEAVLPDATDRRWLVLKCREAAPATQ